MSILTSGRSRPNFGIACPEYGTAEIANNHSPIANDRVPRARPPAPAEQAFALVPIRKDTASRCLLRARVDLAIASAAENVVSLREVYATAFENDPSPGIQEEGTRPIWTATRVKDAALCISSFCMRCVLWLSTVFVATPSNRPISLLDSPSAIDCMTSISLADRNCAAPDSESATKQSTFGEKKRPQRGLYEVRPRKHLNWSQP